MTKICNLCRVIILNSCQIVESLQLHSSRAQFEPGEILKQERAVSVAILLGEETLEHGGQHVVVCPYVLPHVSKLKVEAHRRGAGPRGWADQQGFYIYRNRRLLVAGDCFYAGSDVLHGVRALEDGALIDVFTPVRKDFLMPGLW